MKDKLETSNDPGILDRYNEVSGIALLLYLFYVSLCCGPGWALYSQLKGASTMRPYGHELSRQYLIPINLGINVTPLNVRN